MTGSKEARRREFSVKMAWGGNCPNNRPLALWWGDPEAAHRAAQQVVPTLPSEDV